MNRKTQDYQAMLLKHMGTFPTKLNPELLEATVKGEVILNGGDFSLRKKPIESLFFENMYEHKFQGKEVILLSTPNVRFAYDPATGKEVANTMKKYGVEDRTFLLAQYKHRLKQDSAYLRKEELEDLATGQDRFFKKL